MTENIHTKNQVDILISSALPYANNEMHLGHVFSTFLPADILCRIYRLIGKKVLFVSGSDVYGTPLLVTALQYNKSPYFIYRKYHFLNKKNLKRMLIDIDTFGSTYGHKHTRVVQNVYKQLKKQNKTFWKNDINTFCENEKIFIPDRLSICSQCKKNECEHNNVSRICATCHASVSEVLSPTLFLKLDKNKSIECFERLRKNLVTTSIGKNLLYCTEVESEKAISRNMYWGVKIPENDISVFYVWFDALIGYESIVGKSWKDIESKIMFMGKDNVYFHIHMLPNIYENISFDALFAGNFLNIENEKFSKSEQRGVFIKDILSQHIEYIRFYLSYINSEQNDSNFIWTHFESVTNRILINKIYGSIFRTISLLKKKSFIAHINTKIMSSLALCISQFEAHVVNGRSGDAARLLEKVSDELNLYVQKNELWNNLHSHYQNVVWYCAAIISMLYLFMPLHMKSLLNFFFKEHCVYDSLLSYIEDINKDMSFSNCLISKLNHFVLSERKSPL